MNPIIEAVEAGHYSHGTRCVECNKEWPCKVIRDARVANQHYKAVPPSPEVVRYNAR